MPFDGIFTQVAIDTASSGDQAIVAGVAGKQIIVMSYVLNNGAGTANNVRWKSGSNNMSGAMTLPPNTASAGIVAVSPDRSVPLLIVDVGLTLNLNLSAATQVSGHICYRLE